MGGASLKTAMNVKEFRKFERHGGTQFIRLKEIADKRILLEESLADRFPNDIEQKFDFSTRLNFGLVVANNFAPDKNKKTDFIDSDDARRVRSRIHFRFGVMLDDFYEQPELAKVEYKNAIDLDSTFSSSRYRLWLLTDEKDGPRAKLEIDNIFDLSTKIKEEYIADWYGTLGSLFYNDYHDYLGSKMAFERQVNADKKNAIAHYNLGVILRDKFLKQKEGDELIDKAIDIDSDIIAKLCFSYEKIIADNPIDFSNMYELGVLYKRYCNEAEKGQKLIDRALEIKPDYLVENS